MNIIAVIFSLLVTNQDAEALRSTAPTYLTMESARDNIVAAMMAGVVFGVDPDLLLSIAWHESRYIPATVTPEVGGRVSCGSMTPEPRRACIVGERSLIGGYLSGAHHLRVWLDACHGRLRCALTGYAGGYALISLCHEDASVRACSTPDVFGDRAVRISAARRTIRRN